MLLVPLPAVIVPLVIVHTYLAPVPALSTNAMLPVDELQTAAATVMEAFGQGCGLIGIERIPGTGPQAEPLVTFTESPTKPVSAVTV